MITVILMKQHQNDIANNIKLAASNDNDYDNNWVRLLNSKRPKERFPCSPPFPWISSRLLLAGTQNWAFQAVSWALKLHSHKYLQRTPKCEGIPHRELKQFEALTLALSTHLKHLKVSMLTLASLRCNAPAYPYLCPYVSLPLSMPMQCRCSANTMHMQCTCKYNSRIWIELDRIISEIDIALNARVNAACVFFSSAAISFDSFNTS